MGNCDASRDGSKIGEQRKEFGHEPRSLEEQAVSLIGRDIFKKLVKGYTEI